MPVALFCRAGIKANGQGNEYKALTMKRNNVTEVGLFELNKVLRWSNKAALLVTFDAPESFTY